MYFIFGVAILMYMPSGCELSVAEIWSSCGEEVVTGSPLCSGGSDKGVAKVEK